MEEKLYTINQPIGFSLNRDKIFYYYNGTIEVADTPEVELILPKSMVGKKSPYYKYFASDMDEHYFVGRKKFELYNTDYQKLCSYEKSCRIIMNHEQWTKTPAKYLPTSYTQTMLLNSTEITGKRKHTRPLKMLYFDIETASDGTGFPTPSRNPIAMIGYMVEGDNISIEKRIETYKKVEINAEYVGDNVFLIDLYDHTKVGLEDEDIINCLSKVFRYENPDVVVGYNSHSFDIPYIFRRYDKLGIDMDDIIGITKEFADNLPYNNLSSFRQYAEHPETSIDKSIMGRRLHYDIFNIDVLRDVSLTGVKEVKRKTMKNVSKYYYKDKDDILSLDDQEMENIAAQMLTKEGRQLIRNYQKSDIIQTKRLSDIYFQSNVDNANVLNIPLSSVLGRTNNTIPTLSLLHDLRDNKIICLKKNIEIFKPLLERSYKLGNGQGGKKQKLIQGAYVDVLTPRKTFRRNMYKVDFNSLYPNIDRTFNLSYETISFKVQYLRTPEMPPPDDECEIVVDKIDNSTNSVEAYQDEYGFIHIEFNDLVLCVRFHVVIRMNERGVIPKRLDYALNKRTEIRAELKETDKKSTKYKRLNSEQLRMKIQANATYGLITQAHGIGYLPIGATITAMARYMTKRVVEEMKTENNKLIDLSDVEFL